MVGAPLVMEEHTGLDEADDPVETVVEGEFTDEDREEPSFSDNCLEAATTASAPVAAEEALDTLSFSLSFLLFFRLPF